MPRVLAINAQSKELKSAEQLAELCCGVFSHMGDGQFPIYDGVAIQKFPQRHSALNENEFERKVFQPANILWVNRKLAKGLRKENRVLDLQIRPGFNAATFELNTLEVVAALTAAISKKDLDMQIKILKADRNRQIPVAVKALEGLRRAEEKYHFEFQSIGIDEEFEKLRKDTPTESIVEQFVGLEYSVHTEIITEAKWEIKDFDEEVKKLFADCLREMRKIHKENSARENFLAPYYRNAIQELSGIHGVASVVIKKIAFLWASVKFFITLLPDKDKEWVRRNMFRALVSFAEGQKEPWSASSYLKEYIADEIKAGHCARIRGTKSNDESTTLWYDPKNQVFLLPASLYFEHLLPYIQEGQITRRVFEKKLVGEGTLLTVKRGTQLRRTFEVKTQVGEASILVLRIPLARFWEAFREEPQILNRIRRWHQESTPLRGDNRGFHK